VKINRCQSMLVLAIVGLLATPLAAQTRYDPGASDTEIKIGNIMPYTGPAAAYGLIGRTIAAYFKKINAEGGVNGRRITFVSYDDSYNPAKATEAARKLEQIPVDFTHSLHA